MWARHLLFLVVVFAGVTGLGVVLYPRAQPPRASRFDPREFDDPNSNFREVVEKVNGALAQNWKELELQPAPQAPDLTLLRRLSLALIGTTPSLQEVRQFEAHAGDERLQWWLTGTFQERRYADYLAERLARTYVGTENGPFIIYRRRRLVSWLSDEVLRNRPYDKVARDLIASEGVWTDKPATNFVTVTIEPDNQKGPNPERLAGRVTRAFLGIRLDCAQCHNHPFQKWTQHDFQGLSAFFGQVHQGFTGIYDDKGVFQTENRKTGARETVDPGVPFLKDLLPTGGTRRQRLAAWVTDHRNPYFARALVNRVWALLLGRPMIEPVDDLGSVGEVPPVLQLLADDFSEHDYDLQRLIRVIVASAAFQRDSAADFEITDAHEHAFAAFPLSPLRPEQMAGSIVQASSLETIDNDSNIFVQLGRFFSENQFVQRYGDPGENELEGHGSTIPQSLLVMNGQMVKDRIKQDYGNAATRISWLAPDDARAVETAYLAVLTRRPTPEEAEHFGARLAGIKPEDRTGQMPAASEPQRPKNNGDARAERLEDLYWVLINSTEFQWNH